MPNPYFLLLLFVLLSCQERKRKHDSTVESTIETPPVWIGEIESEGYLSCFEKGLKDEKVKQVYCEASAVVYYDNKIIFVSDKPIPKRTAFMSAAYPELGRVGYLSGEIFEAVSKIEDLTLSPDETVVVATAAFDRFESADRKFDSYNQLIFWPKGQEQAAKKVTFASGDDFIETFRQKVSSSLKSKLYPDITYFKIEGLAFLPQNRLVFGIRELGKDYENFEYAVKFVATSFDSESGTLSDNFYQIYDFKPDTTLMKPLGVSSIEFDRFNDRLLILTSFEVGEKIGAYLWSVDLFDFESNKTPQLIRKTDGAPLFFTHKAEAVSVIDSATLIVIHDDDRVLVGDFPERSPHQNAYSVVRLSKK